MKKTYTRKRPHIPAIFGMNEPRNPTVFGLPKNMYFKIFGIIVCQYLNFKYFIYKINKLFNVIYFIIYNIFLNKF